MGLENGVFALHAATWDENSDLFSAPHLLLEAAL